MGTRERILEFLEGFIEENGFAPSVREIARHLGFRSTKAIKVHLDEMANMGWIEKKGGVARGIHLIEKGIPIIGRVQAGQPTLQFEGVEGHFSFDKWKGSFLLRIKGDSMIGAHIEEGDLVVIEKDREARKGDIVVALVEDETTVKRLDKKNGRWILKPENPDYSIIDKEFQVIGVAIGVIRRY
ncbi:repressor LexA [candidate division WOR-3 bacterium]|nr:repressor LexA [candidate division WOR-3 bacterium]